MMEKYTLKIFWLTAILLILASCISEIEFNPSQTAPMITVNCLATPDTTLKLNLSKTKFFLSTASGFETFTNCEVNLYVNNLYKEKMSLKNSQFISKYKPKPGDQLRLEILSTDTIVSQLAAVTSVPNITRIQLTDTSSSLFSKSYFSIDTLDNAGKNILDTLAKIEEKTLRYAIHFKDSAALDNYYRVRIYLCHYFQDGKISRETLRIRPDDIIFDRKNESDIFDNDWDKIFNIFPDETINGKSYVVSVYGNLKQIDIINGKKELLRSRGFLFPVKSELIIDLQGIDASLFNYLKTVKYNNTDLQYFSEPVQVYSNVKGGTGIFGSYTHSFFKLTLPVSGNCYYIR